MPRNGIVEGGNVEGKAGTSARELLGPAAERRSERSHLLAQAARLLAASLDYERTLSSAAAFASRTSGAFCVVEIAVSGAEPTRRVAAPTNEDAHVARAVEDRLLAHPFPRLSDRIANIPSLLVAEVTDPTFLEMLSPLRPRSMILVPLAVGERRLGALAFLLTNAARQHDATDLEIAGDVGQFVAQAIENAERFHSAETSVDSRHQRTEVVERLVSAMQDARQMERGGSTDDANAARSPEALVGLAIEAAVGQARQSLAGDAGRARVLVVAEDSSLRDNLCEMVTMAGHEPIGVPSAEAALIEIAAKAADFVVTDQRLPNMTGVGLLETLRSWGNSIPAVIISAWSDYEAADGARRLGTVKLVTRPSDIADVLASLRGTRLLANF
jgi:CheY-like chemotaxis protein